MEAYFDNSATTAVYPQVVELTNKIFTKDYGNPSSLHMKGIEAERYLSDAKERIAKILKCDKKEILFTSGATESNNLSLIGSYLANKRNKNTLITTQIEHPSVSQVASFLEEMGVNVIRIPVDEKGIVDTDSLYDALSEDVFMVSVMGVNNETGVVEPVGDIASEVKRRYPDIIFHSDYVQGFSKYKLYPSRNNIDLLSASAHKFHGPKGVGFLFIKDKTRIKPLILGGGQQNNMRSGTDNVPGVAGMALAASLSFENASVSNANIKKIKDIIKDGLLKMDGVCINSPDDEICAPHILNVSFMGVRSEVMLHALEEKGIYVSSGSACSSNKKEKSSTLKSMNLSMQRMDSAIRFSFSENNTIEQALYLLEIIEPLYNQLKKFVRS